MARIPIHCRCATLAPSKSTHSEKCLVSIAGCYGSLEILPFREVLGFNCRCAPAPSKYPHSDFGGVSHLASCLQGNCVAMQQPQMQPQMQQPMMMMMQPSSDAANSNNPKPKQVITTAVVPLHKLYVKHKIDAIFHCQEVGALASSIPGGLLWVPLVSLKGSHDKQPCMWVPTCHI